MKKCFLWTAATRRSVHDSARISVTDVARNDIVLIDKNDVTRDEDSEAAAPGTKATVVNTTVFYAASGCAVGAVVVIVVAVFIFCRCSSRDKNRRHGNLIRRDNSMFRSAAGSRRLSFETVDAFCWFKPISQLRFDYDTTKKIGMFIFFVRVEWKQARAIRHSRIV